MGLLCLFFKVQLQNMMTSKYIAFFLEEISSWQKRLSMVDQVISLWFDVQRTWSHLESIFIGSEDIRYNIIICYPKIYQRMFETMIKIPGNSCQWTARGLTTSTPSSRSWWRSCPRRPMWSRPPTWKGWPTSWRSSKDSCPCARRRWQSTSRPSGWLSLGSTLPPQTISSTFCQTATNPSRQWQIIFFLNFADAAYICPKKHQSLFVLKPS